MDNHEPPQHPQQQQQPPPTAAHDVRSRRAALLQQLSLLIAQPFSGRAWPPTADEQHQQHLKSLATSGDQMLSRPTSATKNIFDAG